MRFFGGEYVGLTDELAQTVNGHAHSSASAWMGYSGG